MQKKVKEEKLRKFHSLASTVASVALSPSRMLVN
jgi:hypothetical protein